MNMDKVNNNKGYIKKLFTNTNKYKFKNKKDKKYL